METFYLQKHCALRHLLPAAHGWSTKPWPRFARIQPQILTCITTYAIVPDRRNPETACCLFKQLVEEHCPLARVSLASFPQGGLGWTLHHADTSPPPPCSQTPSAQIQASGNTQSALTSSPPRTAQNLNATTSGTTSRHLTTLPSDTFGDSISTANFKSGSRTRSGSRASLESSSDGSLTLLSVPLRLCLSYEISGCCPPAQHSPALRDIFNAGSSLPWELPLAAMLLWSCRRHKASPTATMAASSPTTGAATTMVRVPVAAAEPATAVVSNVVMPSGADGMHDVRYGSLDDDGDNDGGFVNFWQRYRSLLPAITELGTLLFFSEEELGELQDPPLATEARAWQAVVRNAYDTWINCAAFRSEVGGEVPPFEEWLWAVGCVESRAFGFRADGRELHAYVPFFCLANFQPGSPTLHVLRCLEPAPKTVPDQDLDLNGVAYGLTVKGDLKTGSRDGDCATVRKVALHLNSEREVNLSSNSGCGGGGGGGGGVRWEPTVDMVLLRDFTQQPPKPPHGPSGNSTGFEDLHGPEGEAQSPPLSQTPIAELRLQDPKQAPERVSDHCHHHHHHHQQQQQQVFIDYGRKDNRSLMFQYGFILHGNPYDRLDWGGAVFDSSCRMRRDTVYDMAEQLCREVEAMSSRLDTALSVSTPKPPSSVRQNGLLYDLAGRLSGEPAQAWECVRYLLYVNGGVSALQRRFRSAAASIVEACGWRNLRERRLVSTESEGRVLTQLAKWVEGQLREFPTTAEQDAQLLQQQQQQQQETKEDEAESTGPEVEMEGERRGWSLTLPSSNLWRRRRQQLHSLAVEYRLERKFLLLSALTLLHRFEKA